MRYDLIAFLIWVSTASSAFAMANNERLPSFTQFLEMTGLTPPTMASTILENEVEEVEVFEQGNIDFEGGASVYASHVASNVDLTQLNFTNREVIINYVQRRIWMRIEPSLTLLDFFREAKREGCAFRPPTYSNSSFTSMVHRIIDSIDVDQSVRDYLQACIARRGREKKGVREMDGTYTDQIDRPNK